MQKEKETKVISPEKTSKKKHSAINSVKEYDKQTPEPISIREKSFVGDEKY